MIIGTVCEVQTGKFQARIILPLTDESSKEEGFLVQPTKLPVDNLERTLSARSPPKSGERLVPRPLSSKSDRHHPSNSRGSFGSIEKSQGHVTVMVLF